MTAAQESLVYAGWALERAEQAVTNASESFGRVGDATNACRCEAVLEKLVSLEREVETLKNGDA